MKTRPVTIEETETLGRAHQVMGEHWVRHLPVVRGRRLVGMVSEREVASATAHAPEDDGRELPVRSAMKAPEIVHPDDALRDVATRLGATTLGALAVLDRGELVGIVSVVDILLARGPVRPPATARLAREAMTADPPIVHPELPLRAAVRLMRARHLEAVPVVERGRKVVGMLSEAHVRRLVGDPLTYLSAPGPAFDVQDAMNTAVTAIREDRPITEIAHYFSDDDGDLEALPVTDGTGAVIGMVSYRDMLDALACCSVQPHSL
jgi:acetoin utilization protein AcuB